MGDSDVIHRWLTQAELDEMLSIARIRGGEEMRKSIQQLVWNHTRNEVLDIGIMAVPSLLLEKKR